MGSGGGRRKRKASHTNMGSEAVIPISLENIAKARAAHAAMSMAVARDGMAVRPAAA